MRIIVSLITLWIFIFSMGCQTNPVGTDTPLENIASPVSPPNQGDVTQMPTSIPRPSYTGLQALIEKAKADLAQRLAVSANEIGLVEATGVTWPDSSLGCPQKGMLYTQVLTPGYLILLEHAGTTFEYHASSRDYITTCENPSPPVPGSPGNT
jgi:hypothetical protein